MGLDLYHIKLTLQPIDKDNFHLLSDFEEESNIDVNVFSKYLTNIKYQMCVKDILIFENLNDFIAWNSGFNYLSKVFIGNSLFMQNKIENYIKSNKLEIFEMKVDVYENNSTKYRNKYFKYKNIRFLEEKNEEGYYYNEIGYMHKCMNEEFYELYDKYCFLYKKEDFEKAYSCVGGVGYIEQFGEEKEKELKKRFKEYFIDNFEFGISLLSFTF